MTEEKLRALSVQNLFLTQFLIDTKKGFILFHTSKHAANPGNETIFIFEWSDL